MEIKFIERAQLKEKPDQKNLGFGAYMTDYMFVMDWDREQGWHDARIEPHEPISLMPACVTLHYAQGNLRGNEGLPDKRRKNPTVPPGNECETHDPVERAPVYACISGGNVY